MIKLNLYEISGVASEPFYLWAYGKDDAVKSAYNRLAAHSILREEDRWISPAETEGQETATLVDVSFELHRLEGRMFEISSDKWKSLFHFRKPVAIFNYMPSAQDIIQTLAGEMATEGKYTLICSDRLFGNKIGSVIALDTDWFEYIPASKAHLNSWAPSPKPNDIVFHNRNTKDSSDD